MKFDMDKKMHLLFAAYMAGGNATIFQNLEDAIKVRSDVDSTWLPIEMNAKKLIQYGTKRVSFIPGTIENSLNTSRLIRDVEKTGINFRAAYFFQHTICMGLFRFRSRVPYIIAMDGTPLFYGKNELWYAHPYFNPASPGAKIKHMLTRSVYRKAFHLLPLSTRVRDSLINDYDIDPKRITVVPPGINLQKFQYPDRRARLDEKRPFNVLFIGADFLRKGGDILAALAIQPEFKDVQFNFITRTYKGPTAENIIVHDNISANTTPMMDLLKQADIFVLPTRADSFSVASLEAMAMGLPVITRPEGGIADIVEEGKTGYLLPQNTVESLAERVRYLKENPEFRVRMGMAGRKRIETHFNIETISKTVVDLLVRAALNHS